MKSFGTLDHNFKPVKAGGLTDDDIASLEKLGWKRETTQYDVTGADVGFYDKDIPTGFITHKVDIPSGTEYMYNAADGGAIIMGCGNPTCWRHLL